VDPVPNSLRLREAYRISSDGRGGLIFGYATLSERTIVEGVEILAEAIADVRPQAALPMSTAA
jgi:DNA-binding transcriptional MocR family regulator